MPFSARLIPLREVANWNQSDDGNISHATGQFFGIQGVRVQSAPGVREIAGWDQPILTQSEGGVLALICRETAERGVEFLRQAKADPGNIGYLQFCPTIQSTWENIRGLKGARPPAFAECLNSSSAMRIVYRAKHNEEASRFLAEVEREHDFVCGKAGGAHDSRGDALLGQPLPDQADAAAAAR